MGYRDYLQKQIERYKDKLSKETDIDHRKFIQREINYRLYILSKWHIISVEMIDNYAELRSKEAKTYLREEQYVTNSEINLARLNTLK